MSTQTKQVSHTPGPWTVEDGLMQDLTIQSNSDVETQGLHGGRKIALIPASLGFDQRDANARLIAAAPELGQELMRTYHDPQTTAGRAQEIEVVLKKAGLL